LICFSREKEKRFVHQKKEKKQRENENSTGSKKPSNSINFCKKNKKETKKEMAVMATMFWGFSISSYCFLWIIHVLLG